MSASQTPGRPKAEGPKLPSAAPVTLHDALVAWLAAHASDPKPEPVEQVQAVLFEPREGESEAER